MHNRKTVANTRQLRAKIIGQTFFRSAADLVGPCEIKYNQWVFFRICYGCRQFCRQRVKGNWRIGGPLLHRMHLRAASCGNDQRVEPRSQHNATQQAVTPVKFCSMVTAEMAAAQTALWHSHPHR
jgi:hypothetical protein